MEEAMKMSLGGGCANPTRLLAFLNYFLCVDYLTTSYFFTTFLLYFIYFSRHTKYMEKRENQKEELQSYVILL